MRGPLAALLVALLTHPAPSLAAPIPDYAPAAQITTHVQLADMAPRFTRALARALGPVHRAELYDPGDDPSNQSDPGMDTTLLWMRDYQLLYTRDRQARVRPLRYLSINPNRSDYVPTDATPGDLPERLPLVHEQGNLVVAGPWVFVGERIIDDNDGRHREEPGVVGRGYVPRSREAVLQILADALDHPVERLIVLGGLPAEGTGHVDLIVLPLGDDTVLVPEIEAKVIPRLRSMTGQLIAHEARGFFDATARRLTNLGLTVVRAPMLPPLLLRAVDAAPHTHAVDAVYFSPANALLTHVEGERTAWVAHMHDHLFDGRWADLNTRYRKIVARTLRAHGWTPRFVEATELGRHLGLFRCVTAVVPR